LEGSRDGYGEVKCTELDMKTGANSYIEIRIIARARMHNGRVQRIELKSAARRSKTERGR
jgi:hypothetical protein